MVMKLMEVLHLRTQKDNIKLRQEKSQKHSTSQTPDASPSHSILQVSFAQ